MNRYEADFIARFEKWWYSYLFTHKGREPEGLDCFLAGREDGEKELASEKRDNDLAMRAVDRLREELAASQAREAQLRFALKYIQAQTHIGHIQDTASAALAPPTKSSALDAALEKARAEERERCAKACDYYAEDKCEANLADLCAAAIRALPKEPT